MLTGRPPFRGMRHAEVIGRAVLKGERAAWPPELQALLPEELPGLVEACWNAEPAARPTFHEILELLDAWAVPLQPVVAGLPPATQAPARAAKPHGGAAAGPGAGVATGAAAAGTPAAGDGSHAGSGVPQPEAAGAGTTGGAALVQPAAVGATGGREVSPSGSSWLSGFSQGQGGCGGGSSGGNGSSHGTLLGAPPCSEMLLRPPAWPPGSHGTSR